MNAVGDCTDPWLGCGWRLKTAIELASPDDEVFGADPVVKVVGRERVAGAEEQSLLERLWLASSRLVGERESGQNMDWLTGALEAVRGEFACWATLVSPPSAARDPVE